MKCWYCWGPVKTVQDYVASNREEKGCQGTRGQGGRNAQISYRPHPRSGALSDISRYGRRGTLSTMQVLGFCVVEVVKDWLQVIEFVKSGSCCFAKEKEKEGKGQSG